jgi:glucose/arabinose dehydrogenase
VTRWVGVLAALVVVALPSVACGSVERPHAQQALHLKLVASGLSDPVFVGAPRSQPGRLYVVEKPGVIRVLINGKLRARPFLDIRSRVDSSDSEQGLLSMAFHPNYQNNHRFFVDYTDRNGDTRVVQFRSHGAVGLQSTAKQLLFVNQPYPNHNGGQLQFGPDGRLYVGMGDGGSGGDPQNHAQTLSSRLGKLLRLNVNKKGARWQVAGYGLRNPWRFSWDRLTHDLYIGDVGQDSWEEVDVRTPAQQRKLNNYGWRVWEGRSRYTPNEQVNPSGTLVFPIVVYSHSGGCSITGGYVYRGKAIPSARGRYFYGDYCSGTIWSLRSAKGRLVNNRREPFTVGSLSSFGEDSAGNLYAVSLDGSIYKLVP